MVPDSMPAVNPRLMNKVLESRGRAGGRPSALPNKSRGRIAGGLACGFRVNFLMMSDPVKFNVGLVQMAVSRLPQDNLARAIAKVEEAGRNGAQVVCLPELFQSQYFCQREDTANFDLAEAVPGPTTEALGRVAQKVRVVV